MNFLASELRALYIQVEGTSDHEKRLSQNELKTSLLYSKLLIDEDKYDQIQRENKQIDENDQVKTQREQSGSMQECSCEINDQKISVLETEIGIMTQHTSDSINEHDTEITSLKRLVKSASEQITRNQKNFEYSYRLIAQQNNRIKDVQDSVSLI